MPGVDRFARSLEMREGGRTMSRKALGEVVSGCPPESRVSSRSCEYEKESSSSFHSINRRMEGEELLDIRRRNCP
jgi:hypothetical protein